MSSRVAMIDNPSSPRMPQRAGPAAAEKGNRDATGTGGARPLHRAKTAGVPRGPPTLMATKSIRVVTKSSELKVKPRRRNLKALSGMRTAATLWIVLGHFQQTAEQFGADTFVLVLGRGYIPVCMYIVLSGFVTHYAYRKKVYDNRAEVFAFYTRRLCRVLFTYYASVLLGLIDPLWTRHDALASEYPQEVLATVFLLQSWFELPRNENWQRAVPTQPNPAGWTISTLLLAWILYPVFNAGMRWFNKRVSASVSGKIALGALWYLLAMLPCVAIWVDNGGGMSNAEFELLYKFPPLRLADFLLGVVLSELVDDPVCTSYARLWRVLPDLTLVAFTCTVLFANPTGEIPRSRVDSEAWFISGLAPLLGIMLLGYSINSDKSLRWSFSALLEHPVLIEVGNWSFAIYCFQYTFFYGFERWQFAQTGRGFTESSGEKRLVAPWLIPYLLALYGCSASWTEVLEKPFARFVKVWTSKHVKAATADDKTRQLTAPSAMQGLSLGGSGIGRNAGPMLRNSSKSDGTAILLGARQASERAKGLVSGGTHSGDLGSSSPKLRLEQYRRPGQSKLTRGKSEYRLTSSFSFAPPSGAGMGASASASLIETGAHRQLSERDASIVAPDPSAGLSDTQVMPCSDPPSPNGTAAAGGGATTTTTTTPTPTTAATSNALSAAEAPPAAEGEGQEDEEGDAAPPSETEVHFEFEIEEETQPEQDYESDPEYEAARNTYDYLDDTDSDGDIVLDDSAAALMAEIMDSALECEAIEEERAAEERAAEEELAEEQERLAQQEQLERAGEQERLEGEDRTQANENGEALAQE